ncbi:MAG: hypothetical protein KA015_00165 [Spirochaetes bacterium]|nr:hypothetical protein [Spirochaetota bacterium]
MGILRRFFGDIAAKISIDADLFSDSGNSEFFTSNFSRSDVERLFGKSGVLQTLAQSGFSDFNFKIYLDESFVNRLELYSGADILIDLRISVSGIMLPEPFFERCEFLNIEWLSASNPKSHGVSKKLLPGQSNSGLGILHPLLRLMRLSASLIREDGFMNVPDHLHLALMYSSRFKFINPENEGLIRSVRRDLRKDGLFNTAWAYSCDAIVDAETNEKIVYNPSAQIYPASKTIKKYFTSDTYQRSVKEFSKKRIMIDYDIMNKRKSEMMKRLRPAEV